MAWNDLTLDRDSIDAFEKSTFNGLNITTGNTVLGIDEDDNLTLDKAKKMLEADVVDSMRQLVNDETFATDSAMLDGIIAVDTRELLEDLLTYKFLELWFYQDSTHEDSKSMYSAKKYYRMYSHYLPINLQRLAGELATVKKVNRYEMRSTFR